MQFGTKKTPPIFEIGASNSVCSIILPAVLFQSVVKFISCLFPPETNLVHNISMTLNMVDFFVNFKTLQQIAVLHKAQGEKIQVVCHRMVFDRGTS